MEWVGPEMLHHPLRCLGCPTENSVAPSVWSGDGGDGGSEQGSSSFNARTNLLGTGLKCRLEFMSSSRKGRAVPLTHC